MKTKVLIADDHKIVRDGLRSLIEDEPDMEAVGEARNGRMALQLAKELSPDVVIMDIAMPDLNGMEAARQITKTVPGVRVIALSMHSDKRFVIGMLNAGASGYLLKDCAFEELARAVRAVTSGQTYLSPAISGIVVDGLVSHESLPGGVASALTPREREVLQLIAEGRTTKEIASRLHVSVKTIETHRRQIMNKLDLHSVADLTKFAIREGLSSLES